MEGSASDAPHGTASRLDVVLAERGLVRSRSRAAELIAAGRVTVDGSVVTKAGARIAPSAIVGVSGDDTLNRYVSRAAGKLIAGLDVFGIDPSGRLALDLGASTGGFTQVLLERGAREVIALDVGHGQLAAEIRNDARVRVVEGCNARDLTPRMLAELSGVDAAPEVVVGDLSFISLTLVLPAIARVASADAVLLLLIKPQFEVGRQGIRAGIAVDPVRVDEAVANVVRCAAEQGFVHHGTEPSPITGEHGNREFLAYFSREVSTA